MMAPEYYIPSDESRTYYRHILRTAVMMVTRYGDLARYVLASNLRGLYHSDFTDDLTYMASAGLRALQNIFNLFHEAASSDEHAAMHALPGLTPKPCGRSPEKSLWCRRLIRHGLRSSTSLPGWSWSAAASYRTRPSLPANFACRP